MAKRTPRKADMVKAREAQAEQGTRSEAEKQLMKAISDNLSPYAVAAIVSVLQIVPNYVKPVDGDLVRAAATEVEWFSELLTDALGGYERQNELADELGL